MGRGASFSKLGDITDMIKITKEKNTHKNQYRNFTSYDLNYKN